jgi:dUTPase
VIDPDYYTGGIHVVLRNASLASYEVQKHEWIGAIVFEWFETPDAITAKFLEATS